jgi:hypothetical protein
MQRRGAQALILVTWLLVPDTALSQDCEAGTRLEHGWCVPGTGPVESAVRPEPQPPATYDLSQVMSIKRAARAGIGLTIVAIPAIYTCVFFTGMLIPGPELMPVAASTLGGAALFYATGMSLLLGSHARAIKVLGNRKGFRINIAGWVLFSLAVSGMSVSAAGAIKGDMLTFYPMTLVSLSLTTPSIVLGLISGIVGKSMANDVLAETVQARASVMPFTSAVPGGMIAGVGGTF